MSKVCFQPTATGLRRGRDDAIREAAQRQRLQPDVSGAAQRREEQTFAAEERRFDFADGLDVVLHRRLEGHDAAGVHAQRFADAELLLDDGAARVNERPSVALQALHDEALAAEKTGADLLVERDADAHALRGAEEGILLRDQFTANLRQVNGNDLAWIRRAERDLLLALTLVLKNRHEQRLASEQAFSCAHQ